MNPGKLNKRLTLVTEKLLDDGNTEPQKVEVWVNKKSAIRSEFYASFQSGLKADVVFEMRTSAYKLSLVIDHDESKRYATSVIFDGMKYDIVRAYETDETVELTCS